MLKEGYTHEEKPAPVEEKATSESTLPLKFRFEDKDPARQEKEEWEIEIDNLFAEMELCLYLPDPDSTSSTTAENDDAAATEKTSAERCQLGEHQLKKPRPRRRDWVDHCGRDFSSFNELNLGVSACENYYTAILDEGSSQLSDDGRGCIILHAPGTGKTCLTVVFILSLMKMYPMCWPSIIAPSSKLLTWKDEFKKWALDIPFLNLNSEKERSVLGISYQLFEQLASRHKKEPIDLAVKKILQLPGLVVLDERHTPRNHRSFLWKALTEL
ncbi:hypothetical protein ACH5RR_034016 [Cinchona calisaya]|uniref:SNF2 N-terminal domain-containing protein n=1 Tax=Cinchona calisaya TaxID=153742 RepID=A0ABD2YEA5_9GENT